MPISTPRYELILASASPRRQQFLRELGLTFTILSADIDETPQPGERPIALARRLAEAKARAVAARLAAVGPPRLIIAADTVVALGETLLGKPADEAEATAMLQTLCDRVHEVHSGVSVLAMPGGTQRTHVNTTQVQMRAYTATEIAAYVATGDPLDKAGAYAIQHRTFAPVYALTGCVSGVIGLPLADLRDLLQAFGVIVPQPVAAVCQPQTTFPCCQGDA
jgi:septum formation protein